MTTAVNAVKGEAGESVADVGGGSKGDHYQRWSAAVIIALIATGFAAIVLFALQAKGLAAFGSLVAVGSAVAGASLLLGGLVGFLFGIPRRLQHDGRVASGGDESREETAEAAANRDREPALYSGNTNLEQISDWLTKILVGVGLVEIKSITGLLADVGHVAGVGLGGFSASEAFAIALIIYFLIIGFLLSYLVTRLYLGRALTESERIKRLGEVERQAQSDVLALRLVTRQLSGDEIPKPAQLESAIKAASRETRSHVFYRAQLQRGRNWKDPATKATMERAIPIFRALVSTDKLDQYHLNHGQLGFALKDQRRPNWAEAESELSKAIVLRGDPRNSDWRSYEFNRAICRIMLDEAFRQNKPAAKEAKARIEADLRTAVEDSWVRDWIEKEEAISKWLELNSVDLDERPDA